MNRLLAILLVALTGASICRAAQPTLNSTPTLKNFDPRQFEINPAGGLTNVIQSWDRTVNVLGYGADATGAADSTPSIQAANNAARAAGRGISIPAGRYKLNSALLLTAPVKGSGPNTILEPHATIYVQTNNITLSDFAVTSYVPTAVSIGILNCTGVEFDKIRFGFDASVVEVFGNPATYKLGIDSSHTGASAIRIRDCSFVGAGIQLSYLDNGEITGNYMDMNWSNHNEPIHASANSHVIITGNTILRSLTDAIDLYSSGDHCVVANNRIKGVGLAGGPPLCESAITLKIEMANGVNSSGPVLGWTKANVVDGNVIEDFNPPITNNRWFGIFAHYGDARTVPAFSLTNATRGLVISHNIIDGFWTDGDPTGFSPDANGGAPGFFAYFAGIHLDGSGCIIEGNIFKNIRMLDSTGANASQMCGIEFGWDWPAGIGVKAVDVTVANNIYMGNGTLVNVYEATGCNIHGNTIRPDDENFLDPRYGILVYGPLSDTRISGNIFDLTAASPYALMCIGDGALTNCVVSDNVTKSKSPWSASAANRTTFANNLMGQFTLGSDNVQEVGNLVNGNRIVCTNAAGLAALVTFGQKGAIITGNSLEGGVSPIQVEGGTVNNTLASDSIIANNVSVGNISSAFVTFNHISTPAWKTWTIGENKYNQSTIYERRYIDANSLDLNTRTNAMVYIGGPVSVTGIIPVTNDSSALTLRMGLINDKPTNITDSFIGVHNTGGPGSSAGDLLFIPRSSSAAPGSSRFFAADGTGQITNLVTINQYGMQFSKLPQNYAAAIGQNRDLTNALTTLAELNRVAGVTGGIQTNLDNRLPLSGGTLTGGLTVFSDGSTLTLYPTTGDNLSLITWKDQALGSARGSVGFTPNGADSMSLNVNGGGFDIGLANNSDFSVTNSGAASRIFLADHHGNLSLGGSLSLNGQSTAIADTGSAVTYGTTNLLQSIGSPDAGLIPVYNNTTHLVTATNKLGDLEIDELVIPGVSISAGAFASASVNSTNGYAVGPTNGISDTIDVLVAGGTTNRTVYLGGVLISNILNFYAP